MASIINNFDIVEDAIESAKDSANSALKENEKYLDSIQGKIDLFTNSLQTMWNNALNSNIIKGFVDLGTSLVKIIDTLGPVLSILATMGITKGVPWLLKITTDSQHLGEALQKILKPMVQIKADGDTLAKVFRESAAAALNSGKAVSLFGGYVQGAGAALKAFFSTPLGWFTAAAVAITAIIGLIDLFTTSVKEAKEAAEKAFTEYDNAQQTLQDHSSTIKEIKDDYEKLSKGVDKLGNNVSLTTEEYARYNEIANKIADMFPKMVSGYTAEGNAILKLKGNVEELTKAYEEEAKKARQALLYDSKNIVKNANNVATDSGADLGDILTPFKKLRAGNKEILKLQDYVNGNAKIYGGDALTTSILQSLKDAGAKVSWLEVTFGSKSALDRIIRENRDIVQILINDTNSQISEAASQNKTLIDAYLQNNDDYAGLDDNIKSLINQAVQNIDDEFITSFSSNTKLFEWINNNFINGLGGLTPGQSKELTVTFNALTKFNNSEISIQEYEDQINSFMLMLRKLGVDENIVKSIEVLFDIKGLGSKKNIANKLLGLDGIIDPDILPKFTKSDLDIINKYAKAWGVDDGVTYTYDELKQKIEESKQAAWAADISFENLSESIDKIQSAYSTLGDAVKEYNTNGFLSLDSLQSLLSLEPEYLALLDMENGQLSINQAGFEALIQSKLNAAEATAIESAITQLNALAHKTEAENIENSGTAAENAISRMGAYSNTLGDVAKNAIVASGALVALNKAVDAAKENKSVTQEDIDAIMSNLDTQLNLINTTRGKLSNNFKAIVDPSSKSGSSFDAVTKQYDRNIAALENQQKYLENEISLLEAKGETVGKGIYEKQRDLEQLKINENKAKLTALKDLLAKTPKESDEWFELADAIWETEHAIQESTLSLAEFDDKIAQSYVNAFDKIKSAAGNKESFLNDQQSYIEGYNELNELLNQPVNGGAYMSLIDIENEKLDDNHAKLTALKETRDAYLAENPLDQMVPNSDAWNKWVDMESDIRATEKAIQDNKKAIVEYKNEIRDLYVNYFDKLENAFSNMGNLLTDRKSYIEKYQQLLELQGETATEGIYNALGQNANLNIKNSVDAAKQLKEEFRSAVNSGAIKEGSEEWVDMESKIRAAEVAVLDAKIEVEELNKSLQQLYVDVFGKINDAFGNRNDIFSSQQDYINGYIDQLTALNVEVPQELYDKLIAIEQQKQASNVDNLKLARDHIRDLEAKGLTAADEEWINATKKAIELEKAIQDNDKAIIEWNKSIQEMDFTKFDDFMSRLGDFESEIQNINDLLSDKDIALEDGTWTDEGITSAGLYYQQLVVAKQKTKEYNDEIAQLNADYKAGKINEKAYYERLQTLNSGLWESVKAYKSAEDGIVSLNNARVDAIKEGINKEIESYSELISLKKEELSAERDLFDFKKNIQKQSKDIAETERKIAALSGSTSAADQAELRKLRAQLREQQEGINDAYYDHAMSAQQEALDKESEAYSKAKEDYVKALEEALKDIDATVNSTIQMVLGNASTISQTIDEISKKYNIPISTNLADVWTNASANVLSFEQAVSTAISRIENAIGSENSTFISNLEKAIKNPFEDAAAEDGPVITFSNTVIEALNGIVTKAQENYANLKTNLENPFKDADLTTFNSNVRYSLYVAIQDVQGKYNEFKQSLSAPFKDTSYLSTFSTAVSTALGSAATYAATEAARIGASMDYIIKKAQEAANSINNLGTPPTKPDKPDDKEDKGDIKDDGNPDVKMLQKILNEVFGIKVDVDGKYGPATTNAVRTMQQKLNFAGFGPSLIDGYYGKSTQEALQKYVNSNIRQASNASDRQKWFNGKVYPFFRNSRSNYVPDKMYAKGTLGTKKDEWAIDSEPEWGDELVLIPGKNGNLSYMRKGTGVVPADMTERLWKLAQIAPNQIGNTFVKNVVPDISNNNMAISLNFDSFIKADNINDATMEDLNKMIDKKIDKFSRDLNYAIRGKGAR